MVIIAVTILQLLRQLRHVPLTNTCSICQIVKHSFMAVLVHFPYFIPPKWEETVATLICYAGPKWCLFAASHP